MAKVLAKIVVLSHLSDANELITHMCGSSAIEDINFAKYIILETGGNLSREIDADEMYSKFKERITINQLQHG